jgi:PhnB protein
MTVTLNPYIGFNGNAKQAMEFYKTVFGGTLSLTTYGQGMPGSHTPEDQEKIMHGALTGDNGIMLMAGDSPSDMQQHTPGSAISISLSGDDETLLRGYWEKLTQGGKITMPLEKAPWGDTFGMCTDQFGIDWLVNITGAKA